MADDLFDPTEIAPKAGKQPKKNDAATSDKQDRPNDVENMVAAELLNYIERIERLNEEKASIAGDIKDVKAEAKGRGYDVTAINEMVRLRAMDKGEREERENMRDTYAHALGIFG